MDKKLVMRGALAGTIAGLLAFVFAKIVAEPQIQAAINYESGRDAAQDVLDKAAGLPVAAAGPDVFSRTVQSNVGVGVGLILFGAAMGALFAVAYTICIGRVGNLRPRTLALLVALGGFLGMYFVPFVKYPANPPSIGHPETIRERGAYYLIMVFASVAVLVLAVWLGQRLKIRFGNWDASLLATAAFVAAVGTVMAILPEVGHLPANVSEFGRHATETPQPLTDGTGTIVYPGFPADVLFNFRLYSVAAQALLWATIGLVFAPMAERLLSPVADNSRRDPNRTPAAV